MAIGILAGAGSARWRRMGARPSHRAMADQTAKRVAWKITWIRRGRLDADTWEGVDIPLGEESEQYRLRVLRDGQEVMEFTTTSPQGVISNAQITTHDLDPQDRHISIEVAQISNAYGPGIAAVLEMG